MSNGYTILTGAAGNVGGRLAQFLLEKKYNMILTVQTKEHIAVLEKYLENFTSQFKIMLLDLNNQESIDSFVFALKDIDINGLINCAACDNLDDILSLSYENMKNIMNVNYLGTAYLTKLVIQKNLAVHKTLSIINFSSLLAGFGANNSAAYSASKAALESFSRNVVCEFASQGIVCNTIRLAGINGKVDIYGAKSDVKGFEASKEDKNTKNDLSSIPCKRLADFSEINNLVEFLLIGRSNYINGHIINIDGGISIKYPGYSIKG